MAVEELIDGATKGKLLRALLVSLGANDSAIIGPTRSISVGIELFQTAILMHDDVMDQDDMRRGRPSTHAKLRESFIAKKVHDPNRTAESLTYCIGDMGFFSGFSMAAAGGRVDILKLLSDEYQKVAIAQMDDVYLAASPDIPDIQKIRSVYRYKTGRYTIGLPLVAGHTLAGGDAHDIEHLWDFSMHAGELFQLRDDELSIWGNPDVTGKPIGSDIREGKKTLLISKLYESVGDTKKDHIRRIFAKPERTPDETALIVGMMNDISLSKTITKEKHLLSEKARQSIDMLSWDETRKQILRSFLTYLESRES